MVGVQIEKEAFKGDISSSETINLDLPELYPSQPSKPVCCSKKESSNCQRGITMWNRSGSASWVSVVAVLATFLSRVPSLHGNPVTAHCAVIGGIINSNRSFPDYLTWTTSANAYYSVGADTFAFKHSFSMNAGMWPGEKWFHDYLKPRPKETDGGCFYDTPGDNEKTWNKHAPCPEMERWFVDINVYAVHEFNNEGKRRVLSGWLHVEVELEKSIKKREEIVWIYLQMRDEHFNAIGEFVLEEVDQCPPTVEGKFLQHTKFQVLPCSAIGLREAKVATALFMIKAEELINQNNSKYLPKEDLTNGIHFTWRYSEYWCSRHLRIRPDVFMLTTDQRKQYVDGGRLSEQARTLRKAAEYWLRPEWFGVADIRVPSSKLVCNQSVIEFKNHSGNAGKVYTSVAPWLSAKSDIYKYFEDYYREFYVMYNYTYTGLTYLMAKAMYSCHTEYGVRQLNPKDNSGQTLTFGGRCANLSRHGSNRDQLQSCNPNVTGAEFEGIRGKFQKYSEYHKQLIANRTSECEVKCELPSINDIQKVKQFPRVPDDYKPIGATIQNLTTSKSSTARFMRGRRYHGIVSVIATMFFTPVSIFSARYYKETFMNWQSEGCHIWFWVHIGATMMAMFMYLSSLSSLTQSISNWGRSLTDAGRLHTQLGWLSHGIFLLLAILGGYRMGVKPGGRAIRIMIMTLHSLLGILNYFINIGMIVSSSMIPNSPSLSECNENGLPEGVSIVTLLAVSWLFVDLAFHFVLTLLQFIQDKRLGVKRGWYCPIIPILPADSHGDFKGASLRKVLFGIYIFFSFGFASIAAVVLGTNDVPTGCEYGPMSCNTTQNPYGCSALSQKFRDLVLPAGPV